MTSMDRLLTEDVPTRPEPAPPQPRPYQGMWTRTEQDAHWAALCAAVGTPDTPRPNETATARQTAA
jgi:hypothetical protein